MVVVSDSDSCGVESNGHDVGLHSMGTPSVHLYNDKVIILVPESSVYDVTVVLQWCYKGVTAPVPPSHWR
jgi:hypothetical protein